MANDVNNEQVVTGSGVVEAVAATEESEKTEVATVTGEQVIESVSQESAAAPAGQTEEHEPVPYSRFKEVNEAKNQLKEENEQLRGHLHLAGKKPAEPAQQEGLTMRVMKEMGVDPEGYISPARMAEVNDKVLAIVSEKTASQVQDQAFIASHNDFAEVVGSIDPFTQQFVCAPPLARALKQNPQLADALKKAGSGANVLAYELASKDTEYMASKNKSEAVVAEKVIKASMTSVSAVGTNGVIDKAAQISAMTDQQIQERADRIESGAGV